MLLAHCSYETRLRNLSPSPRQVRSRRERLMENKRQNPHQNWTHNAGDVYSHKRAAINIRRTAFSASFPTLPTPTAKILVPYHETTPYSCMMLQHIQKQPEDAANDPPPHNERLQPLRVSSKTIPCESTPPRAPQSRSSPRRRKDAKTSNTLEPSKSAVNEIVKT